MELIGVENLVVFVVFFIGLMTAIGILYIVAEVVGRILKLLG